MTAAYVDLAGDEWTETQGTYHVPTISLIWTRTRGNEVTTLEIVDWSAPEQDFETDLTCLDAESQQDYAPLDVVSAILERWKALGGRVA
jgi:hypothetical protein